MIARIARAAPVAGLAVMLVAILSAQIGLSSPLTAFGLTVLGWLGGALVGSTFGLLALRWGGGDESGRGAVRRALGMSAAMLAGLLVMARGARVPAIHDVTTDPDDPPHFAAAADDPANRGRDLSYPHGNPRSAELQRQAYPDLHPIRRTDSAAATLDRAAAAAAELGWRIVARDDANGRIEATAVTRLFRFVDDIVIRVREEAGGSIVDVRSTSRVGRSDLGANAARIRAFAAALGSPFEGAP